MSADYRKYHEKSTDLHWLLTWHFQTKTNKLFIQRKIKRCWYVVAGAFMHWGYCHLFIRRSVYPSYSCGHLRTALGQFHPIWQKHPLGLRDKWIGLWWSQVKVKLLWQHITFCQFFGHDSIIIIIDMLTITEFHTNIQLYKMKSWHLNPVANGQFIWSTGLDAQLVTLTLVTHFESLIFGAAVFNLNKNLLFIGFLNEVTH